MAQGAPPATSSALAPPPPVAPSCTVRAEPTGPLAPWSHPIPFSPAADIRQLPAAALPIGRAVDLALIPTPQVHFRVRSEKPGGPVTYGGMIMFNVRQAGTYRVALGSGAWIDMVSGSNAVASVSHGHGPACSTIHKMVDFPLMPGRYTLQIGGNTAQRTKVLVVRLP
jgi:hypothetical protein